MLRFCYICHNYLLHRVLTIASCKLLRASNPVMGPIKQVDGVTQLPLRRESMVKSKSLHLCTC